MAPGKRQRMLDVFFQPVSSTEKPIQENRVADDESVSTSVTKSVAGSKETYSETGTDSTATLGPSHDESKSVPPRPGTTRDEPESIPPSQVNQSTSGNPQPVLWSDEEALSTIQAMWPSENLHNYFKCKSTCFSLSTDEKSRLRKLEELKIKEKKKPDKFKHEWLASPKYWSICYVEGQGFFCMLCKKHNMKNSQNKSQIFIQQPSIRLKEDSIKKHMSSSNHLAAIDADLMQRLSVFHQVTVERNEVETKVLNDVFSTIYWMMKEFVANRKLLSLLKFMKNVIGVSRLQYFNHTSTGSIREIFLTVGHTVRLDVVDRVRQAKAYGIMIDEVTDIAVCSQLVTFIQYWDTETQKCEISFMSAQNVLEDFESCNADAIKTLVLKDLDEAGLDVGNLMGLSTDGASVMLGKANGVAAKLREKNGKLLNIHCVCHRLALACTDSCNDLKVIRGVEDTLRQLWYYFKNSPKKMACFLKCQLALNSVHLSNPKKSEKLLSRRLQKACQTRWLSFGASVSAAVRDFEAIVLTLQQLEDATGLGLLMKMREVKFLGTLYILNAILPILSRLSQQFQAGRFHFSMVKPAVRRVQAELLEVKESMDPLEKLKSDIDSKYTHVSDTLRMTKNTEKELASLLGKYTDALSSNMEGRLGSFPEVIGAYAVFDPHSLPDDDLGPYGMEEIEVLGKHFYHEENERISKLKSQWNQVKYFLSQKSLKVPDGCQSSTYVMSFIVKNKGIFHPDLFEELLYVVEVGLCLPCSNAWPERGASILKITKTKSRNRLNNDMLNSLMHVAINGPSSESSTDTVNKAVTSWLKEKRRKKLKRKGRETVTTKTTLVENETEDNAGHHVLEEVCLDADPVQVLLQEQEEIAAAVSIGLSPESDSDSAFESDYDEFD